MEDPQRHFLRFEHLAQLVGLSGILVEAVYFENEFRLWPAFLGGACLQRLDFYLFDFTTVMIGAGVSILWVVFVFTSQYAS